MGILIIITVYVMKIKGKGVYAMSCSVIQKQIEPYILGELDGNELESFIRHIEICNECYEELEIHYTIAMALQQYDNKPEGSYDISRMLMKNLEDSARYIRKQKIFHTYRIAIYLTSMVVVAITLGILLILWISKGM